MTLIYIFSILLLSFIVCIIIIIYFSYIVFEPLTAVSMSIRPFIVFSTLTNMTPQSSPLFQFNPEPVQP